MKFTPGSSVLLHPDNDRWGTIRADLRKNEAERRKGKREDSDHMLWGAQRSRGWGWNIPEKSIWQRWKM